jgi:glycosyltransferase involved in cell wall biosynthesis
MKQIIFFNSNKAWGGGEKWHFEMSLALKDNGFQVTLITNPASELYSKAQAAGLDCIEFPVSNLSFLNPIKRYQLRQLLKSIRPHAVFMNLPSDVKLCASIAKSIKIPHIVYRRGMPNTLRRTLINSRVYKSVTTFIANSDEIKKSLIKNYPEFENKVEIVFNGVEKTISNTKAPSKTFMIGHLGRLVDQKGYPYLVEVVKILKSWSLDFKLLIGGKGPLELELKAMVKVNGLESHIEFLGHTKADVFFNQIDLFTFTSKFEGSANALIESLSYEVPAIAFNISSMPEVVEDGMEGLLVDAFDTISFAKKVQKLALEPALLEELKRNTHKKIIKDFLYENKIKQVMEIIK